jgi:nucleoid-associated protein YgaU
MRDITKHKIRTGWPIFQGLTLAGLAVAGCMASSAIAADLRVTPAQQAEAARTARTGIPVADLAPDAPQQYTVRRGDTLWDISGRYLRQPWRWPELWGMNRAQVRNPHLIYPGQILYLITRDGRAYLSTTPAHGDGTIRLSPHTRAGAIESDALPSIAPQDIEPFLTQPLVVAQAQLDTSARIVALPESRVYLGHGEQAYVRGVSDSPTLIGSEWQIYRPLKPLRDPATREVLGYEAEYLGNGRIVRGPQGPDAVSTVQVLSSRQEMGVGNLMMPQPPRSASSYMPHAPDGAIQGLVAGVYGGVRYGGARQVVVLNVGSNAGVENGHVLQLSRASARVPDRTDGGRVIALPEEQYGLVFVFRVFERVSYALVTDAANIVNVGDAVSTPN